MLYPVSRPCVEKALPAKNHFSQLYPSFTPHLLSTLPQAFPRRPINTPGALSCDCRSSHYMRGSSGVLSSTTVRGTLASGSSQPAIPPLLFSGGMLRAGGLTSTPRTCRFHGYERLPGTGPRDSDNVRQGSRG